MRYFRMFKKKATTIDSFNMEHSVKLENKQKKKREKKTDALVINYFYYEVLYICGNKIINDFLKDKF